MPLPKQLEATRAHTLPLYDLPAEAQSKSYAPDKWTIRQLLNHLADAETVLYERVRRVIAEQKPVL